ncbi:hypothetical protein C3920_01335 [Novacetimonas pomaceti]|uniref:Uncharacterized protein n=1 Tax=Novacetimonas pomaceti TaxID=2021998 RepID=A0A318QKA8_9PROT|nr:hypothetical protein C3920_01335 [Novacetimonas pomaceti]PYD75719.1 hypothetical protein CFR71_07930 [Novacetimonas pomaceti]
MSRHGMSLLRLSGRKTGQAVMSPVMSLPCRTHETRPGFIGHGFIGYSFITGRDRARPRRISAVADR